MATFFMHFMGNTLELSVMFYGELLRDIFSRFS